MISWIMVKVAIWSAGAFIVSSVLRIFVGRSWVWNFIPRRVKKIIVFLLSFIIYALIFLGKDVLLVLISTAITTHLAFYFYKHENKFKEFLRKRK